MNINCCFHKPFFVDVVYRPFGIPSLQVSKRLGRTNHPAMVTVPDMVAAKHWLRLMRAEQQKDIEGMKYQILQPTLEINPR